MAVVDQRAAKGKRAGSSERRRLMVKDIAKIVFAVFVVTFVALKIRCLRSRCWTLKTASRGLPVTPPGAV